MEEAGRFIGDEGYDPDQIGSQAKQKEIQPIIPRRSHSTQFNSELDPYLYKLRHLVGKIF